MGETGTGDGRTAALADGMIDGAAVEPGIIQAIVIDARECTVKPVKLATLPGDPSRGFGTQIAPETLAEIFGSKRVEQRDLGDGEIALVAAPHAERTSRQRLQYDGVAVVASYDAEKDAYADTKLSAEETRRIVDFENMETDQ